MDEESKAELWELWKQQRSQNWITVLFVLALIAGIPLLTMLAGLNPEEVFPASVSIILPVCLVSLLSTALTGTIAWREALVWLPGSAAGGILAGFFGKRIPVKWLHRGLGLLILWGGIRYLW